MEGILGRKVCGTEPIQTLKKEEVHLNDYEDIADANTHIEHFIQQVSNQKRPHSVLDYLTPIEFEQKTCLNFMKLWSDKSMTLQCFILIVCRFNINEKYQCNY
ncbi:transposase [Candidatus Poribacteria bacterium]|nr:transposase [Candidatus Poribacteria bacterium]